MPFRKSRHANFVKVLILEPLNIAFGIVTFPVRFIGSVKNRTKITIRFHDGEVEATLEYGVPNGNYDVFVDEEGTGYIEK